MNPNLDPESENLTPVEREFEKMLRPADFIDFVGQKQVVDNLIVFVKGQSNPGIARSLRKIFRYCLH